MASLDFGVGSAKQIALSHLLVSPTTSTASASTIASSEGNEALDVSLFLLTGVNNAGAVQVAAVASNFNVLQVDTCETSQTLT